MKWHQEGEDGLRMQEDATDSRPQKRRRERAASLPVFVFDVDQPCLAADVYWM
jgi:hypothetical protein